MFLQYGKHREDFQLQTKVYLNSPHLAVVVQELPTLLEVAYEEPSALSPIVCIVSFLFLCCFCFGYVEGGWGWGLPMCQCIGCRSTKYGILVTPSWIFLSFS